MGCIALPYRASPQPVHLAMTMPGLGHSIMDPCRADPAGPMLPPAIVHARELMASDRPPFAITMGDPCGIGPEIVAKLFRDRLPAPAFVIGDAGVMRRSKAHSAPELSVVEVDRPMVLEGGLLPVLAVTELPDDLPLARVDARAGAAAFAYVEAGIRLALRRDVAGLVTAPINKAAFKAAGGRYPGHTEILADRSAAGRVGM